MEKLFDKVYDAYQADCERAWKLFQAMTVTNGGLLFVLSISLEEKQLWSIVSIFGCLVCVIWSQMQFRYGAWCGWWDKRLGEVERAYLSTRRLNIGIFQRHCKRETVKELHRPRGYSTRKSPGIVALGFAVAWLLVGCYSVYAIKKTPRFVNKCEQTNTSCLNKQDTLLCSRYTNNPHHPNNLLNLLCFAKSVSLSTARHQNLNGLK